MTVEMPMLAQQFEAAEASLPDRARVVIATFQAANAAAAERPADDLRAALVSGDLTPKNAAQQVHKAATALAAQQHATGIVRDLANPAMALFRRAVAADADRIIADLQPRWNQAASAVHAAAQHFTADTDPAHVLSAGPQAAEAWTHLDAALNTLDRIRGARVALATCGYGTHQQDASWFIASAPDAEALARANAALDAAGNGLRNLVEAGFRLRLNTADQAQAVASGAKTVTEQREAQEHAERVAEHQAAWAPFLEAHEALVQKR